MTKVEVKILGILIGILIGGFAYFADEQGRMILLCICLICTGLLLLIGTKLRWWVLTDPPKEWNYTHSWLKKTFGAGFLIPYNYFLGTVFLLFGLTILASMYS